jgi:hypothetical protein
LSLRLAGTPRFLSKMPPRGSGCDSVTDRNTGLIKRRSLFCAALVLCAFWPGALNAAGELPVMWDKSSAGATIDPDRMKLVFSEEFDRASLNGPKLFAPVHAPYGAGTFDPPAGRAYQIHDGMLTLRGYRQDGKWHSGSVQTADADQAYHGAPFGRRGFACRDCYFETRLRFPAGTTPGIWGGFWLLSPDASDGHVEIDVLEWYGGDPKGHHHTVHIWPRDRATHSGQSEYKGIPAIGDGQWHSYGAQVDVARVLHVYMDRREVSKVALPAEFDTTYYALLSLAILPKQAEIAKEPLTIDADYVRAYR